MAGENVALRKQCQQLEKNKAEMESEQSKKVIESLHELRVKEAKLKQKCKKYQKERNEAQESLKQV